MNQISISHDPEWYENIFNMYEVVNENNNSYVFYNILNKITLPNDIDDIIYDYYIVEYNIPLTILSYNLYESIHLWWLILLVNNIKNPVLNFKEGSVIKIIKKEYLDSFIKALNYKS